MLKPSAIWVRNCIDDLSVFGAHLGKIGKSLDASVEAYNSAVGSLERQVLPSARRFTELGLKPDRNLDTLDPVDKLARAPSGDVPDSPTDP